MSNPTPFSASLPDDAGVVTKLMFGQPCAFINRQMFFGTFGDSLIARIGPVRVTELVQGGQGKVFEPREGLLWRDYVQVDASGDATTLRSLAMEAMRWTAKVQPRAKPPKRARKTST